MLKTERQFVVFIKCKDSVVVDIVIPALFKKKQKKTNLKFFFSGTKNILRLNHGI